MAKRTSTHTEDGNQVDVTERMTLGFIERVVLILMCGLLGVGTVDDIRDDKNGAVPYVDPTAVATAVAKAVAEVMAEPVKDHERRITYMETTRVTPEHMAQLQDKVMEAVRLEFRASIAEFRDTIRKDLREELSRH